MKHKIFLGFLIGAYLFPTVSFAQATTLNQNPKILKVIASLMIQIQSLQKQLAELKAKEKTQGKILHKLTTKDKAEEKLKQEDEKKKLEILQKEQTEKEAEEAEWRALPICPKLNSDRACRTGSTSGITCIYSKTGLKSCGG